jgi:two-component system, LytTR family, sensor kinase
MIIRTDIRKLTFWHYQLAGWSLYALSDLSITAIVHKWDPASLGRATFDLSYAFLLTLVLRSIYSRVKYRELSIALIIIRLGIISLLTASVWVLVSFGSSYLFSGVSIPKPLTPQVFLQNLAIMSPIPFGWSVLYFGIKYWRDWQNEKERTQKAELLAQRAQIQMLRYQLNPHFLFNALSTVRGLIDENIVHARSLVTELSEFLRYSLISMKRPHVLLREELSAIRQYIALEKARYDDNLDVSFDVPSGADEIPILSFLIQPLVENAIIHGMQTSPMPLKICIRIEMIGSDVKISVINTGKWIPPRNGTDRNYHETGLGNVRARLDEAYGHNYIFKTIEKTGSVHSVIEIHNIIRGSHEK